MIEPAENPQPAEDIEPAENIEPAESIEPAEQSQPAENPLLAAGVDSDSAPVDARDLPVLLTVRPHRIAIYARISATVVVATMVLVGVLLRNTNEGVAFRTADQVGLIGLGVLIGAAILGMARPRLRVYETGMKVRNVFGENMFEWPLVLRVAFPEGSNWAQLMLPDDESHAVMAIQAMDKQRAVEALRAVRELHARYAPPAPEVPPARDEQLLRQERDRPLGRLEIIDRARAAGGDKPKRRG